MLNTRSISRISLFAGLIAAGSYISVPLPGSPVPVVLANLFVVLAGMVLGLKAGLASVALFLLLGAFGLPVYAAGSGGLAHIAGPTGGFLIGYLLAAATSALVLRAGSRRPESEYGNLHRAMIGTLAATAGMLVLYIPGATWMGYVLDLDLTDTLAAGVLPFLPGDLAKAAAAGAALPVIERALPALNRYTPRVPSSHS